MTWNHEYKAHITPLFLLIPELQPSMQRFQQFVSYQMDMGELTGDVEGARERVITRMNEIDMRNRMILWPIIEKIDAPLRARPSWYREPLILPDGGILSDPKPEKVSTLASAKKRS